MYGTNRCGAYVSVPAQAVHVDRPVTYTTTKGTATRDISREFPAVPKMMRATGSHDVMLVDSTDCGVAGFLLTDALFSVTTTIRWFATCVHAQRSFFIAPRGVCAALRVAFIGR
eukprot:TRINITY_DN9665_c0_g1_i1.p1 TRINITY_DN9665_c0_g1~~TRINITY_DN9665_c0_g1_i1.p1  ORF type:complete len:114 (+),score=8.38 TRINITY_DN9665_c0_g1_i1:70-411(+)